MIKYRYIFISYILILLVLNVNAQDDNSIKFELVSGVVTDHEGEPIIGASIYVNTTRKGTVTNLNGEYKINAPLGSTLTFSYMGYETVASKFSSNKLNIVMKETTHAIKDVVVTGYSQKEIRKSTGSVSIISGKELNDVPLKSVDQLLQGKMAGVVVSATSGQPGASAKIRIRGTNTITGDAEPLWVVDGVPIQKSLPQINSSQIKTGDFSTIFANGVAGINPQDIESVTVLKDAQAAAIYGSRASNGVIVVTTKKGKSGPTHVSYSGNVSYQTSPQRNQDLMDSKSKLRWEQELWDEFSAAAYNNNLINGTNEHYPVVGVVGMIRSGYGKYKGLSLEAQNAEIERLGETTTDWFDELFRNSISQSHNLSVSGGSDKLTYYTSLGYTQNDGILINNNMESYNFSLKLNAKPNKKISFGLNSDFSYLKSNAPSSNVNMFDYAYFANPYEKLYNADGSYAADQTYFALAQVNGSQAAAQPSNGFNIMRELNETSMKNQSTSLTLRGDIKYDFTKSFYFSGIGAFSYYADASDNFNGKDTYAAYQDRPFEDYSYTSKRTYSSITQTSNYNLNYMLRGQLNYSEIFASRHRVSAMAGSEIRSGYSKSIFAKRYNYDPVSGIHTNPIYPDTGNGTIDYDKLLQYRAVIDGLSGQGITEDAFASFYASLDYILDNKYTLNYTIRTDGSNNFGSNQQFNPTWSAGFSWNIDEESFMSNIDKLISSATLRLATGYTGGVNKSVYPVLIMNYLNSFRTLDDEYYRQGNIINPPNPNLRWEKTWDIKASLNWGMFEERVNFNVEAYHRKNKDQVTSSRVTTTTGYTSQMYNTSEQINQGLEFSVNGTILKTKNFRWYAGINTAYNLNKLTKYVSISGSINGEYYVNYPLNMILTGKTSGINPETGMYNFIPRPDVVINSISDARSTDNYIYYAGTANAPWNGGFSTTLSYKNLSLNIGGTFAIGAKVKNKITSPAGYQHILKTSSGSDITKETVPTSRNDIYVNHLNVVNGVTNRWTVDNPITTGYPRLIDNFGSYLGLTEYQPSSYIVTDVILLEDVSFLKINNVTLTYSIPERLLNKIKIQSAGLSASMNNILTLTNYSGFDPENPGAVYPQSRTFSFGVYLGF